METGFKAYFKIELFQALKRRNIIVFAIIALILLFSAERGRGKFERIIHNQSEFQKIEALKVKQYLYISQYGGFGFDLFFSPPPLSAITDSDLDLNILATINAHNKLELLKNIKSKNVFSAKNFNYSNIIMVIGALLALFYGLGAFKNHSNTRYYSSIFGRKKLFVYAIISRSIIFIASFLILHLCILLYLLSLGMSLFSVNSFASLLTQILSYLLFISIGCSIASIKNKEVALFVTGITFAAFVFLFPYCINLIAENAISKSNSPYKIGYDNLSIIIGIESELYSRFGKYIEKNGITKEIKARLDEATKNEYQKVKHNETKIIKDLERGMHFNNLLNSIFLVTFNKQINKELGGGKGCHGLISFYKYCLKKKEAFTKHYFIELSKKREPKKGSIKSFIKGDENIFFATPQLPDTYPIGIIISFLYIAGAVFIAYRRYLKIFTTGVDCAAAEDVSLSKPLQISEGEVEYFRTKSTGIAEYMYQVFCGNCQADSFVDHSEDNFIYLPDPEAIPINKKVLAGFAGFPGSYLKKEKWEILFRLAASTGKIIYVDGWFDDLKPGQLEIAKEIITRRNLRVFCVGREKDFEFADTVVFSVTDKSISVSKYFKLLMEKKKQTAAVRS